MTSIEGNKPFGDADVQEAQGMRVERLLFFASTLVLALVVPVWIGTISRDVYAAGAVDPGGGVQAPVTVPGRAIDAKKVDAKKADVKDVEATQSDAKKLEPKKTRGTEPVYIPPDP